MDAHAFLQNLAIVLCVAAVATVVFQRLHQPVVFGYLLAGTIIGPHIPVPLVADQATVNALSELGVILLMFSLGLEFTFRKLMKVSNHAGPVALFQFTVMMSVGYLVGQLLGFTRMESIFAGAMISIASTTIIVKAFQEQKVKGRVAELVFGVLIIEDLIAIFLLTILTTISRSGTISPEDLGVTAVRLAMFLVGLIGVGLLVVPRTIRLVHSARSTGDDAHCEHRNLFRRSAARAQLWLLGCTRRFHRRITGGRIGSRERDREARESGAGCVRRDLLRVGRDDVRSNRGRRTLEGGVGADTGRDHREHRGRDNSFVPGRSRAPYIDKSRNEPRADWRVLLHHRRPRSSSRSDRKLDVSGRDRGGGDHDSDDAASHSPLQSGGGIDRPLAAGADSNHYRALRVMDREGAQRPACRDRSIRHATGDTDHTSRRGTS